MNAFDYVAVAAAVANVVAAATRHTIEPVSIDVIYFDQSLSTVNAAVIIVKRKE